MFWLFDNEPYIGIIWFNYKEKDKLTKGASK